MKKQYIVLSTSAYNGPNSIQWLVEEWLEKGWQCQGGVSVCHINGVVTYFQAMIYEVKYTVIFFRKE